MVLLAELLVRLVAELELERIRRRGHLELEQVNGRQGGVQLLLLLLVLLLELLLVVVEELLLVVVEVLLRDVVEVLLVLLLLLELLLLLLLLRRLLRVLQLVQVGVRNAAHDLHPFRPVALVHGAKLVAAAAHPVSADGLQLHANVETLLEAAVGAALSLRLVDVTTPVGHTGVHLLVLHGALEEALAALAGEQSVVVAAGLVERLVGESSNRLAEWPRELGAAKLTSLCRRKPDIALRCTPLCPSSRPAFCDI